MIEFNADRISISGPRASDGTYKVTFETGEYQQQEIAELFRIPQGVVIKVKVEYEKT